MKKLIYQQKSLRINKISFIGDDMGSFHVNFDMDGACGDIYAMDNYFIAKNVCMDIYKSFNEGGEYY